MKSIKPYIYFWIAALIIFIFTLVFYKSDEALDINIHDTYYIIAYHHIAILLASLFTFIGIVYWVFSKTNISLNKLLTNIHTIVSIGCIPFYYLGSQYFKMIKPNPNFPLFDNPNEVVFISAVIFVFILIQVLFLFNLIISTTKHFFRKS